MKKKNVANSYPLSRWCSRLTKAIKKSLCNINIYIFLFPISWSKGKWQKLPQFFNYSFFFFCSDCVTGFRIRCFWFLQMSLVREFITSREKKNRWAKFLKDPPPLLLLLFSRVLNDTILRKWYLKSMKVYWAKPSVII